MLGEELQITCTATNDQDAPLNLMFSWRTSNNVTFNKETTEEDGSSHTAMSTLHISTITRSHGGMYRCIVRNGEYISANSSEATTVIVEGKINIMIIFKLCILMCTTNCNTLLQYNHHHH